MNLATKPAHSLTASSLFFPMSSLAFASAAGCTLLAARIAISGHWRQLYLVWNLFLAWLPLIFALLIARFDSSDKLRGWRSVSAALAWLIFFPNAPYILTDLTHLRSSSHERFWVDLTLILLFGLTGLVLGFLSLYLMQRVVARRFGWPAGWLFTAAVAGLSGFGIYVGRFLRWNSWDILINPLALLGDIARWLLNVPRSPGLLIFPVLFATLLLIAYTLLYALTHLSAGAAPLPMTAPNTR
jgi:uncharacterized membrane protein